MENYHYTWFTWNWNVGVLVKKEKAEKTIHTIISPKDPVQAIHLKTKSNYLKKTKPEVIGKKRIKIDFYDTDLETYLTKDSYLLFRHKSDPEDIIRFGYLRHDYINFRKHSEEITIRLFPLEKQNNTKMNYYLELGDGILVCIKDIIAWTKKRTTEIEREYWERFL